MTAPAIAHPHNRRSSGGLITFESRIADAVRQIRRSATIRTPQEDQVLKDFARGRNVLQLKRLVAIASTCKDPADATALADCIRGESLRGGHQPVTLTELEAMRLEAAVDGVEDLAVQEYLANPCQSTRLRAIEALRRVVERSQAFIDALHRGLEG